MKCSECNREMMQDLNGFFVCVTSACDFEDLPIPETVQEDNKMRPAKKYSEITHEGDEQDPHLLGLNSEPVQPSEFLGWLEEHGYTFTTLVEGSILPGLTMSVKIDWKEDVTYSQKSIVQEYLDMCVDFWQGRKKHDDVMAIYCIYGFQAIRESLFGEFSKIDGSAAAATVK